MKGLLLIIFIYLLTLGFCAVFKVINQNKGKNKRSDHTATSKIYYVTTKKKPKQKTNQIIPIKASMVEKERLDN